MGEFADFIEHFVGSSITVIASLSFGGRSVSLTEKIAEHSKYITPATHRTSHASLIPNLSDSKKPLVFIAYYSLNFTIQEVSVDVKNGFFFDWFDFQRGEK